MEVECLLPTYDKNGEIDGTLIKVSSITFDGTKVRLTMLTPDRALISANLVGEELISAVKRCMLDWRGR